MDKDQIEQLIQEHRNMCSETTFNLEGGFGKTVDSEKYARMIEDLLRKYLPSVDVTKVNSHHD